MSRRILASDINPAVLAAAGINPASEPLSKSEILEQKFADQITQRGLPEFVRQHRFAKEIGRQWRFDFAFLEQRVAVEIQGLVVYRAWVAKLADKEPKYSGGRVTNVVSVEPQMMVMGGHATITGFRNDCEKLAWARALGWSVLTFEQSQVRDKFAIDMLVRVLAVAPRVAAKPPVQPMLDLPPPAPPRTMTGKAPF